jgi:hypothetical protein
VVEKPSLFGVEPADPGSRQKLRHGCPPAQNNRASCHYLPGNNRGRQVACESAAHTDPDKRSEVRMPNENDDLFGEEGDEAAAEFNRLTDLLFQHVSDFADEEEVADDILPLLLLQLSVTTRMMAYAMSVAKPSSGGLKLDLDRFRRDADDLIRVMKKDADGFIERARESIEAEEAREDES